jgi:predicted RNA-binding Zn ribbon-like protein
MAATVHERTAGNLELVGGRLCLDFANTVSTRIEPLRREYLTSYQELVGWARHAGILTDGEAKDLLHHAARQPQLAEAALKRAISLRETIYGICLATIESREPDPEALTAFNQRLLEALSRLEISASMAGFKWTWAAEKPNLDQVLWPVVRSAADLLTSQDLGRLRQCAGQGCDWLFLDLSRNSSRRWCSMDACGSRAKSQRYYLRRKQAVRLQLLL